MDALLDPSATPAGPLAGTVERWCFELVTTCELERKLARADLALARAEGQGAFAAEVDADGADAGNAGEQVWHRHLQDALAQRRARLAEFVVIDRAGALSHL